MNIGKAVRFRNQFVAYQKMVVPYKKHINLKENK